MFFRKKKNNKVPKNSSFARWLSVRIMVAMGISNVLLFVVILAWVVFISFVQNVWHYHERIDYAGQKLEAMLNAVEVSSINNAVLLENQHATPEQVYAMLEQELRLNPHMVGCFAAFKSGYYPRRGRWFEPYVARRDSGYIERMQLGNISHDYFQIDWYQKAMSDEVDDKGFWSDPYFDDVGAKALLCSYIVPIHNSEGEKIGVLGADLSLDSLTIEVRRIISDDTGRFGFVETDSTSTYGFIVDKEGRYIVHPFDKIAMGKSFAEDVKKTADKNDDRLWMEMSRNSRSITKLDGWDFAFFSPVGNTNWSMAIVVPSVEIFVWVMLLMVVIVPAMIVGHAFVFGICMLIVHRASKPLHYLTKSAEEVAKGRFDILLPLFRRNDEIRQLRDSFDIMQHSLTKYVEELKETTAANATMESELNIAHSVQMSMLPKTFPPFPERDDIEIYGELIPAKAVGGDLYDFFIRDEKLFFCIGDVSGKGMPASLVMVVTRTLFRNIAAHTAKPERIVSSLNNSVCDGNDAGMFVTLFVGVLDLPTGYLHYCNAGHDAPLMFNVGVKEQNGLLPVVPNLPVGVFPNYEYEGQEGVLKGGTTLFLYTDGLTEAENSEYELFGMSRIREAASHAEFKPEPLVKTMFDAVHQFVGDTEQSDDLTMLAVSYTKQQKTLCLERSLTLHNNINEVEELAGFVDEVCEAVGFDASVAIQMNLAIEEAVVNVMDYAYPKGTEGEVRIKAEADDECLVFIISDDGIPFDPTGHEEVDTSLSAEERDIGGLGIHLVRNLMDSINYERVNDQNVFTLKKKL